MNRAGHLGAAVVFTAVAIVWSFPLVLHLSTAVPGPSAGDNVNFLWNFWWARTALASGESLFFTPRLFAPVGIDLTLHTHTVLPAVFAATALRPLPLIAGLNLTIIGSLFLNGFCAYLLAWRVTRDWPAALAGGLIFGGSPYVSAHLSGHFNLISAWVLPLFALAAIEMARGSRAWAAIAGLVVAATAYIDYYYVLYELACALCITALTARSWSINFRGASPRTGAIVRLFIGLILLVLIAIGVILFGGGFDWQLGPFRVSAHDTFNLRQVLWMLLGFAAWLHWSPRVSVRVAAAWKGAEAARAAVVAAGTFTILAAPILWHGWSVIQRGEYVTQRYFWRSAPKGIDLGTLVLGNPLHGVWGKSIVDIYNALDIDWVEGGAWLGVAPAVVAAWVMRRHWHDTTVRFWTAMGAIFFVWSLGPHLMLFGWNTGMVLPQTVLRYVPIAANARVPGRAIVITYLAMAMLVAIGVAAWRASGRRSALPLAMLALLIIVDYIPAPFALTHLDHPAIYATLRDLPTPGTLLELPVGTRDSFASRGLLDHRVLGYQRIHERPVVGGVVSRLAPSVTRAYRDDPLINALLELSESRATGPPTTASAESRRQVRDALKRDGIRFVMLNRETAPAVLVDYVERMMPLTLVATEGSRSLYEVE